jgi:hypothetical protein
MHYSPAYGNEMVVHSFLWWQVKKIRLSVIANIVKQSLWSSSKQIASPESIRDRNDEE